MLSFFKQFLMVNMIKLVSVIAEYQQKSVWWFDSVPPFKGDMVFYLQKALKQIKYCLFLYLI